MKLSIATTFSLKTPVSCFYTFRIWTLYISLYFWDILYISVQGKYGHYLQTPEDFIIKLPIQMACLYCLTCTVLFYPQLMAVSVGGLHGQYAVRLVGLVPSLEADSVITPPQLLEDKTALRTSRRRKVVSLRHVLVSNHHMYITHLQDRN